jgi:hypothetical protein
MKNFQTQIYNQIAPIGIDNEIYRIQNLFSKLPWLEACFGSARIQRRLLSEGEATKMESLGYRGTKKYELYYPQGIKNQVGVESSIIDQDLTFDDSYASRIFFLTNDMINPNPTTDNWDWITPNIEIGQKISIILHCNLNSLEIDSSEQVKIDTMYILNNCQKIKGLSISESMEDVWKEFTLTPEINGCTRYPFYCLRVDFLLTYMMFPVNGENTYQPNYLE